MNEADESHEEAHFRKHIFYVVLDNVFGRLTVRYSAAKQISDTLELPEDVKRVIEAQSS